MLELFAFQFTRNFSANLAEIEAFFERVDSGQGYLMSVAAICSRSNINVRCHLILLPCGIVTATRWMKSTRANYCCSRSGRCMASAAASTSRASNSGLS